MLQGYWAEEWQQEYCKTYVTPAEETPANKTKQRTTMDRWLASLLKITWTSMISLWKIQNDEQHSRDKETREAACHKVLTNELQLLYINQKQYPPAVQNLLIPSLEEHCGNKSWS
jgi:hypothetical protein